MSASENHTTQTPKPLRKLIVSAFVSLDGVMQAPGGPTEDPTGGFALGGWTFTYWDQVMGRSMSGDVAHAVAHLKSQAGNDLQVIGSANLIQTLHSAALIDEYNMWTFPVVIGRGKRLFESASKAGALRLVNSQASSTGVLLSTYMPAGAVPIGSFAQTQPSERDLARQAKMAHELR